MKHIKLFEAFLNESHAYICGTCGERAEHEEIDANPRMKCSNCGDSDWQVEESLSNEGQEVAVADMKGEADALVAEIKDSLDFASSKLYDFKKMSDYIKAEYPELSRSIAETVEPMMTELEQTYPQKLQALLKKFK